MGCQNPDSICDDIVANQYFRNSGYILYFQNSEDGMRDFWFFPVCLKSGRYKIDSTFIGYDFKKGICFKLPLTGELYTGLSKSSYEYSIYGNSSSKKIFYCPVLIEFDKPENSTFLYSKKPENWILNLNFGTTVVHLSYFVSNNSKVKLIKPLVSN